MTKAEQFFHDNAGFSWNPQTETQEQGKERCAREIARAEEYAREHGWYAEWELEQENPRDVLGEPDEVNGPFYDPTNDFVSCVLWSNPDDSPAFTSEVLASLGMIEESKDVRERQNYRRVIEAELALEALMGIETEQRNAEECARLLLA